MSSIRYCLFLFGLIILFGFPGAALPLPVPDFTVVPVTGPAPLTVQFTDTSLNRTGAWAWFFGDETYKEPWTLVNASAGWSPRIAHTSVAMPDGSIVLMGGIENGSIVKNDTWLSDNGGVTWIRMNGSAGWSARYGHNSVVMPDGSIVLMGGYDGVRKNDTWRSTDKGATWSLINASSGWTAREMHNSVVTSDSSIVLMGGYIYGGYTNDTWRSTNNGTTWTRVNASSGWTARQSHSSVAMKDGSIILMGGIGGGSFKNDTWRSRDNGATWTQQTASPGWSARYGHSSVVMPDSSIVLMGGGGTGRKSDVWRSTDYKIHGCR